MFLWWQTLIYSSDQNKHLTPKWIQNNKCLLCKHPHQSLSRTTTVQHITKNTNTKRRFPPPPQLSGRICAQSTICIYLFFHRIKRNKTIRNSGLDWANRFRHFSVVVVIMEAALIVSLNIWIKDATRSLLWYKPKHTQAQHTHHRIYIYSRIKNEFAQVSREFQQHQPQTVQRRSKEWESRESHQSFIIV